MKKILSCLSLALLLTSGSASEQKLAGNGIELTVNPVGGRISSFQFKGRELTAGDGLLVDNFSNIPSAVSFLIDRGYDAKVIPHGIAMSVQATGGGIDFLRLAKEIRIPADDARVIADYTFENTEGAMGTLEYAFWLKNFAGSLKGGKNYFFPSAHGILTVPEKNPSEIWINAPARGWCAVVSKDGSGFAQCVDFNQLKNYYGWYARSESAEATQESHFIPWQIPAGQKVRTRIEFIPFQGLSHVSGAGNGVVGSISVTPQESNSLSRKIDVALHSSRAGNFTVELFRKALPDGGAERIDQRTVKFDKPGSLAKYSLPIKLPTYPTLYDIECRVFDQAGKPLAVLNAPTAAHCSLLAYKLSPPPGAPAKQGITRESPDLTRFDNSAVTPHIPWAVPLAKGKLRVLALTPSPAYRELAELAQRVDIELHSVYWTLPYKALFQSGDHYGSLTDEDVHNNLNRLLQQEYDVIFLSGINWAHLRKEQQNEIRRKVENGTGLVENDCYAPQDQLPGLSAFTPEKLEHMPTPTVGDAGFLSDAVPYDLFQPNLFYSGKTAGKIWAKVFGKPFVTSKEYGKGRVVSLGFYTYGGNGRMMGGVSPELKYPDYGKVRTAYWEPYSVLFAKSLIYAARREGDVTFGATGVKVQNGKFDLELNFHGRSDSPLTLQVEVRDPENRVVSVNETPFAPDRSGRQRMSIPAIPYAGKQMLVLRLKDAAGRIVDFGAVSAEQPPANKLIAVTHDKPSYVEGETATFKVKLAVPVKGEVIDWQWRDAYGRLLAEGRAAHDSAIPIPVVNNLKMRRYTFCATLAEHGRECDLRQVDVLVKPAPDKLKINDYEAGIWLTPRGADAIRQYLHPLLAERLRELGIVTILTNTPTLDTDFAMRWNFNPTNLQMAGMNAAKPSPEFEKTGNKMLLARKPCLSDPAFRAKNREIMRKAGAKHAYAGMRFHWMGDELTLTAYWSNPVDYCFSEHCLTNFRAWLMRRYGTLDALNRQWGSSFANLADVIPETRQEAWKRRDRNYSAWADHLEYMDWLLCDYVRDITDNGLRQGDRNASSAISGPQQASAYGGNNWQTQSGVYDFIMSYGAGALRETMHSFAPDTVDLPWESGYDLTGANAAYALWKSLMNGASGAMAFASPSIVRPDYTFSKSGKAALTHLAPLTRGVGKLFVTQLKKLPPEALIVYSQPSIRAAFIAGETEQHTLLRWKHVELCRAYGIPFRFVSPEEIERGILKSKSSAKLLLLPSIGAVSPAMESELNGFASRGGTIVIEGSFAEFDEHCKARPKKVAIPGAVRFNGNAEYHKILLKPDMLRTPEEKIQLKNCAAQMADALGKAEITPRMLFTDETGAPVADLEIEWFTDATGMKYILALTQSETPRKLNIRNASAVHLLPARPDGKVELSATQPLLAAVSDRKMSAEFSVAVSSRSERARIISINGSPERSGVFRLEFQSPDGSTVRHYSVNAGVRAGKVEYPFEFALDDKRGEWRVIATDVLTGVARSERFSY